MSRTDEKTAWTAADIPDLTACAGLTINHLVLHSRLGKAILTQPCYEMQLKMRGSLREMSKQSNPTFDHGEGLGDDDGTPPRSRIPTMFWSRSNRKS